MREEIFSQDKPFLEILNPHLVLIVKYAILKVMNDFFSKKTETNYLYFSIFLLLLIILSSSHNIILHPLYFFYVVFQALLEVGSFILISHMLKRVQLKWIYSLFIIASFVILLRHAFDFILINLLDCTSTNLVKLLFFSGIKHLLVGFEALNIGLKMWLIFFGGWIFLPLIGLIFYRYTFHLSMKKPLHISFRQIIIALLAIGGSIACFDWVISPHISYKTHLYYTKRAPLGTSLISYSPELISLSQPISEYLDEDELKKMIPQIHADALPNIYLFIIETFRKDFLSYAPTLTEFGKENISIKNSYANSNGTHLSWFSIFHAELPFHWEKKAKKWKSGSIPLQMLKSLGYKIHLYSSADLQFFNMDEILFGENLSLLDSISFEKKQEPYLRDKKTIEKLKDNLTGSGNVHIIFLDSTHSEYSFPPDFPIQHLPICEEIDYLEAMKKNGHLNLIKNRYKNAIFYIDSLIGDFFKTLKEKGDYNSAIITLTGDHGEEFFEEGALFHGTHLNKYQTNVPLIFKFPSKTWESQTNQATHIDIFPSILHFLTKENDFKDLFDGSSIFSSNRSFNTRIAIQQNGGKAPDEFCMENENSFLHAKIKNPKLIEIIELKDFFHSDSLNYHLKTEEKWFAK